MKLRMIALLCVAALLCGCGAQEAAPVTPETAAPTEAVTEAPTEPTTEPTTVPTEPPTAVELLGYGTVPFKKDFGVLVVSLPEKLPAFCANALKIR